jgi:hypothetical protein
MSSLSGLLNLHSSLIKGKEKLTAPGVSTCFKPLKAWQPHPNSEGQRRVYRAPDGNGLRYIGGQCPKEFERFFKAIEIPCGQCMACRLNYSTEWAMRITAEATLYERNCFITLTYDDAHMPANGQLVKKDLQDFKKRLREKYAGYNEVPGIVLKPNQTNPIRTFDSGEYGDNFGRPHYHLAVLNFKPLDLKYHNTNYNNDCQTYRSPSIEKLWGKGYVVIGDLTAESASYVARYVTKKINGKDKDFHYNQIDPETGEIVTMLQEFATMSRRPGIGMPFLSKYPEDCSHGTMLLHKQHGVMHKRTPKYFENKLAEINPTLVEQLKAKRLATLEELKRTKPEEFTPERRAVNQQCFEAKTKSVNRKSLI